ncbi:hypothetical protein N7456_010303 [Penicillium angulare]|uniref:RRM domain-containing protein n=1 Tax=Penicillium angulare TaxID=116970 RepID=A0A9W9K6Y8_9EURO|nr:hypothetical protein N7456_010303 [Penicillium angulare]
MLNPFQIKDLNGPSSSSPEGHSSSHGIIQISASEYDSLASSHPRARLIYTDDDDGDQITVGSSLELSQRLDEPLDIQPRLDAIQLSEDDRSPMHIFDIRRSNSVTELWKRFEDVSFTSSQLPDTKKDASVAAEPTANTSDQEGHSSAETSATAAPGDISQPPLLAAFEAEMANILDSSEEPAERAPQAGPSPTAESSRNAGSQEFSVENLAWDVIQNLLNGAKLVKSELHAKLPELQRQVRDAQNQLPANMGNTLQKMLSHLEARLRTAFNNLPENGRQWADNSRHWAEEAFHAGRPVAENAAESLRMVATEVNGVGRSFITAFEQELARATSQQTNMAPASHNPPPTMFSYPTGSAPASSINTHNTEPRSMASASGLQDNHATGYEQFQPGYYGDVSYLGPGFPARAWGSPQTWAQPAPSESLHSGFLNRSSSNPAGDMDHKDSSVEKRPAVLPPAPPLPSVPWWSAAPQCGGYFPSSAWPQNSTMPFGETTAQVSNSDADLVAEKPSSDNRASSTHQAETSQVEHPGRKTLFIGNVGFRVTERTIQDVFASKGFIVDVDLPMDVGTGQHAGFGYLHFPSVYPAIAAMDALQGTHIDGHAINLEYSDAAPIDSVDSQTTTDGPRVSSSPPTAQDKVEESTELNQTPVPPMKRRKSVTFKDAPPTEDQPATYQSSNPDAPLSGSADEVPSAPLIDLSMDEYTANLGPAFPSVSNELSQPEHDDPFDPEVQLRRFPPVSQLEAQVLANQRQHTSPSVPLQRSRTISYNNGQDLQNDDEGLNLRRANTTLFGHPKSRQSSRFGFQADESHAPGLNRRTSERRLSRGIAGDESDTWARLDKRTRKRSTSRPSSRHSIPGSFPVEEPQNSTAFDADLENCVSSLIDMGYGTAEDGGRSRMAVYAAASNNDLMDAIEMIEEERKAYERHR